MSFFDDKGVLGLNSRNLEYIKPYNKKKAINMADDKLKTKKFLSARGIPVPRLYGVIRSKDELYKYDFGSLPSSFIVKPNHGYGGEGIIPIVSKRDNVWVTSSGEKISHEFLLSHISDILDGRFSISNIIDSAFFEQLLVAHESVGNYSYRGLPDIRIVVHNLIPVMAMLRLPSKESKGKANLHQGAFGVGIDIGKGETTYISYKNKIIDEIPGVGPIKGLKIPFWDDILLIASKCQLITNLGYLAADVAIDKTSGPVLLEINARAGLGVQIANLAPLKKRLQRIQGLKVSNPEKGIRIAKDMFGNVLEKNIQSLSGKTVIGTEEIVELILKEGIIRIPAKINTGYERTIIDEKLADEHGLRNDEYQYNDEKSTLKLKFSIGNERLQTVVDIEKITDKNVSVIIGRRDLTHFYVDPAKKTYKKNEDKNEKLISAKNINTDVKINYSEIDQKLIKIDEKLKILYYLRPLNLMEEKQKFFKNFKNNPQFVYPELNFDLLALKKELDHIATDNSPLGLLFEEKRTEIYKKINLLNNRTFDEFTDYSIELYGRPDEKLTNECLDYLAKNKNFYSLPAGSVTAEEAKTKMDEIFKKYSLEKWETSIKENMVSDAVAGKNNRLFLRKGALFTPARLKNLIIHEIETHILTAENGKNQNYEMFNRGFANYLETQEGMAIYNIISQEKDEKYLFIAISLVVAVDMAMKHSFVEIFEQMLNYKIPPERAFRTALKVKRGLEDTSSPGGFTKDFLYYKGYKKIKDFVGRGGSIKDLYIGKFSVDDIELIKQLPDLKKPKYLPKWL
ncbi:DUF1704 domain-containing protein [Candidatus Peregrinibacteria bacterium]|nr:DUF1704 domain-containing protein [Candidatus Peregrinibacteria bacterium]